MATIRMFKPTGGFHNALDHEVSAFKKDGWVEAPLNQKVIESPKPVEQAETIESVRAKLDAVGIKYDKRLGLSKLVAMLR